MRSKSTAVNQYTAAPFPDRFWAKYAQAANGCLEWQGARDRMGYGSFGLDGRIQSAHRIAYTLRHGPIPEGMCVLHRCDNPPCGLDDHLFLGTKADNSADCYRKKRANHPAGEVHPRPSARLTVVAVRAIRVRYADGGVTCAAIARDYGVDEETVRDVIKRRTWRHVD